MFKVCIKCGEEKPVDEFRKHSGFRDGRHSSCKACVRLYDNSRWRKEKAGKQLFKKYGITQEEYNRMLEAQSHACKICGKHVSECRRKLAVDHCHSTGKVRGLLCDDCNMGLGMFKDNVASLRSAIAYLEGGHNV